MSFWNLFTGVSSRTSEKDKESRDSNKTDTADRTPRLRDSESKEEKKDAVKPPVSTKAPRITIPDTTIVVKPLVVPPQKEQPVAGGATTTTESPAVKESLSAKSDVAVPAKLPVERQVSAPAPKKEEASPPARQPIRAPSPTAVISTSDAKSSLKSFSGGSKEERGNGSDNSETLPKERAGEKVLSDWISSWEKIKLVCLQCMQLLY